MRKSKELLWGYIDGDGAVVIAPRFHGAWDFHEGLAMVRIDYARGYIDTAGNFVVSPVFQGGGDFHEGLACVMEDDKWGYIDRTGNIVIPLSFDKAEDFRDGKAKVCVGQEWFFIDKEGKRIEGSINAPMQESQEEFPAVRQSGDKLGYINREGNFVIEPKYCDAEPFVAGKARVRKTRTGKWSFIDTTGKNIFKEKFIQAHDFHEGFAAVLLEVIEGE